MNRENLSVISCTLTHLLLLIANNLCGLAQISDMQRFNSKTSVRSMASSLSGDKREKPTHMIIQREGDQDMVMLPVSNLVNGAATRLKLHDRATFKIDLHSRKQERGTIVVFGKSSSNTASMKSLVRRIGRCLSRTNASIQHGC